MAETARTSTLGAWMLAGLFGAAMLAGGIAAVVTLHARAETEPASPARAPLVVSTTPIALVSHYLERESYVGRIEAARQTAPAAERSGLLMNMMVEEGDVVEAGAVLARLDLRPLELTRARLLADRAGIEADIDLAERTVDRRSRLVGDGWSSGQSYDEALFSVSGLTARRDGLDAQIAQIDLDIEKSTIRAPFAGRVAARLVDEGAVIAAGTPLMQVQETGRPQARIGIPPSRVIGMAPGDTVTLTYQGRRITGRIAALTPDLDVATRTVPVLIDILPDAPVSDAPLTDAPVPMGPVTMGQVIRLTRNRRVETPGAWVHLTALQEAERGLWSLMTVAREDGADVIRREAVEVLHIRDTRAFVRGTFADGVRVVAHGGHRISAGQIVAVAGGR